MRSRRVAPTTRICLSGKLDGSRAMEVVSRLRAAPAAEVLRDLSDVQRFEAFRANGLLRELLGSALAGRRLPCSGLPPCLATLIRGAGIAVAASPRPPRWWAP